MARSDEAGRLVKALRSLLLGMASVSLWPAYLALLGYMARQAPWSRSMSILGCALMLGLSLSLFLHDLVRWLTGPSGWAETYLGVPQPVSRQVGRAGRFLVVSAALTLLPAFLIDRGLIAADGRVLSAPSFSRLLILAFEVSAWGVGIRLLSGQSPLLAALAIETSDAGPDGGSRIRAALDGIGRHRRAAAMVPISAIGAVIVLDVCGYSFSAHRLTSAGLQTATVLLACLATYRALARLIDRRVAGWAKPRRSRSWASALTSAMARRAATRPRKSDGLPAATSGNDHDPAESAPRPEDLAAGLRRLLGCAVALIGFLAIAWLWELDLAFVRFVLGRPLWSVDDQTSVTIGDLGEAFAIATAGALAWRYMGTVFALTLFHRMPDDPGVRFAVVMLCRYAALALASIAALSAIRLDMARIGVVLAALGVGLGFGLQEIVSNFVCGIILLLERPIRIGDIVTVAETTGRVDRIHIRATTIINAENQCMIVPNREFITGKLVNWTHRDKILRVTVKLGVAYGSDPDQVAELLISVARRDPDVLMSPAPLALMEGFGDSSLLFALYAYVPDPALIGPVRHRLCSEVQRRFAEAGIEIPFPVRELRLTRIPSDVEETDAVPPARRDEAAIATPGPHARSSSTIRVTDAG